jgi:hypothetical protein
MRKRVPFLVSSAAAALLVLASSAAPARAQAIPPDVNNIAIVLDCSGSMMSRLPDGKTRIEAAKDAAAKLVSEVSADQHLAFIVYGLDPRRDCKDIDVKQPLALATTEVKDRLIKFIAGIRPLGHTPLAASMEVAGAELKKGEGTRMLLVLTDGMDTCKGNPGEMATALTRNLDLYGGGVDLICLGVPAAEMAQLRLHKRETLKIHEVEKGADLQRVIFKAVEDSGEGHAKREVIKRIEGAKAKRGPLEIALVWHNKNDLDLHVIPPSKEEIFYKHKKSKCGGEQDVDMNVDLKGASKRPVEHVVWAKKAPAGKYQVWVHHYQNHGGSDCKDPTHFVVTVQTKEALKIFRGEVSFKGTDKSKKMVVEFNIDKNGKLQTPKKTSAAPAAPDRAWARLTAADRVFADVFRREENEADQAAFSCVAPAQRHDAGLSWAGRSQRLPWDVDTTGE